MSRYTLMCVFFAALSLTACSLDNNTNKSAIAPPPAVKQETIAPIPSPMDTFRALAPPDGMKFTPLFSENITDTNARLKRLEDAVQTIRNDVDTLAPTMVRMVSIEKDIKGLVAQLQTITDQQGQSPAPYMPPATGAPSKLPPKLPQQGGTTIPGEDVAKGTEPAKADEAKAGPVASSDLVTPEAASKGELPPKGAASPNSTAPTEAAPTALPQGLDLTPQAAPEKKSEAAPAQTEEDKVEKIAEAEEAPSATPAGAVVNLRINDEKNKTQLILDLTADAKAPVKMINNGRTLVVNLAHFTWGGRDTWESDHKQLITGGTVKNHKLYVELKRAAQFTAQKIQPPSGDEKNYRLIIDLSNKIISKKAEKKVQKAPAVKAITAEPPPAQQAPPSPAPAAAPAPKAAPAAPAQKPSEEDFP